MQIKHVADPKFRITQPARLRLHSRQFEQVCRKVDAENRSLRTYHLRGGQCRGPASAAHVKDPRPSRWSKAFDRCATKALPEGVRGIIVAIGRRVVGGCGWGFCIRWAWRARF